MASQKRRVRNERKRQKAERKRQLRLKDESAPQSSTHTTTTTANAMANRTTRHPAGWFVRHVKWFWSVIGVIASAASIAGGYSLIRPNITIEPDFLKNEQEPFSAYFRVKNDEYFFSIYDLRFECEFTGGQFTGAVSSGNKGQEPEKVLGPGESATKNCSTAGFRMAGQAFLVFSVRFRPMIWPVPRTKRERFAAIQDDRGVFHWTHRPLSE